MRGTFTWFNPDFTEDVRHLLARGLDRHSLEPVVTLPEEPYALRDEDLPRVEEEYERLAAFYRDRARNGQSFTFFHFLLDLDHGPASASASWAVAPAAATRRSRRTDCRFGDQGRSAGGRSVMKQADGPFCLFRVFTPVRQDKLCR